MEDKKQPIIVKKINKAAHGHHGGAWKVAYADFVTAMMAFFLLMWLLGGTSHLVREGISDYFKNPAGPQGPGGASFSMIKLGGAMDVPRSKLDRKSPSNEQKQSVQTPTPSEQSSEVQKKVVLTDIERLQDRKRLDDLLQKLKETIENSQKLKSFKDQLILDVTPEGLRVQIVDKENRPMFDASSAVLKSYTRDILRELAKVMNTVPNRISISGHTDVSPFSTTHVLVEYGSFEERRAYSNWELSADRANAARRELIVGGLTQEKIARVVGLAASSLFDKDKPTNPVNRRISIIVLNKEAEAAMESRNEAVAVKPAEIPQRLQH